MREYSAKSLLVGSLPPAGKKIQSYLNCRERVEHGIHIQIVSPFKDVEGLHVKFHYNLYHKYVQNRSRYSNIHVCVLYCSIRYLKPESLLSPAIHKQIVPNVVEDQPPEGYVKSILPCTPLAIVKCLEHTGVYNKILPYGDRAYGKTVTVINRYVLS